MHMYDACTWIMPELMSLPSLPSWSSLQNQLTGGSKEFLVRASYLEIYNEDIRDLLSKNPEAKLDLKESPDR